MNLINVVALRLAALHPADQRWLLNQLNRVDAEVVKSSLAQLGKLLDLERGVSEDVLDLITVSSQAYEHELSELCRARIDFKRKVELKKCQKQVERILNRSTLDYLSKVGVLTHTNRKSSDIVLSPQFETLLLTKIMSVLENTTP
ncbi:hypothetical protein [Pseudaeromonas pectinilytica]